MKDYSRYLGCMFYRTSNEETEVVRVVSFVNTETARIKLSDGTTDKIKFEELEKKFVLINPDGYVYFNIVELNNNIQDIIVCFYRASDIGSANKLPYCVARQNIYNVYSHMIHEDGTVGCCMSIDTIPEKVDYNAMRACNDVKLFTAVAMYNCDKPEDVLSCIRKIKLYDDVLHELHDNKIALDRKNGVSIRDERVYTTNYMGYCMTLSELLDYTDFWKDVRSGMGIITLPRSLARLETWINGNLEDGSATLDDWANNELSKELGVYVTNERLAKLTKFINLNDLKSYAITGNLKTALIADPLTNVVYVLTYVEGNKYIEEARELEAAKFTPEEKLQIISGLTQ